MEGKPDGRRIGLEPPLLTRFGHRRPIFAVTHNTSPVCQYDRLWPGRRALMRRRDFITLLGGAAATWPLAARAQQTALPVIGFLHTGSPQLNAKLLDGFRAGLAQAGFVEGRNVAIEFRWAEGEERRLPELAADLVRQRVSIIATPASTPAAVAAKAATRVIPIVFATGGDPIELGLVASLNRPGANVTGIAFQTVEIAEKQLGLLRELLPRATRLVALVRPNTALTEIVVNRLQAGAAGLGREIEIVRADSDREIEAAFARLAKTPGVALLFGPDPTFTTRRVQLVALAARYAVPAMYAAREYAEVGGLVSYGPDLTNAYRETGVYVGRILKGDMPADLPVAQPVKFELVINLKTAKALAVTVPDKLLALADEVIE
jgi:putative tryptophan/tyrosine transport system substrate-binding protein